MKETVLQFLRDRDLQGIFNESDYKYYLNKVRRNGRGGNKLLIAMNVMDMFIFNSRAK